jgi:VCBS repeat-containing protein
MRRYSVDEDTALIVGLPGVLANDSDGDDDALSASLVSGPSHGSLAFNADGSFTYNPDADYSGADSFTYRITDGAGNVTRATVNLTVVAVADAPDLKV